MTEDKLATAIRELAFQYDEKEKRAADRINANKELEEISNTIKQTSLDARSLIEASLDSFFTISPEEKIAEVK